MKRRGVVDKPYIPIPYRDRLRFFTPHVKVRERKPIFRSKLVTSRGNLAYRVKQSNPSTDHTTGGSNACTVIGTNVFIGSTNPWWKDRIRNHEDATTSASGTLYDYSNPYLSAEKHAYNTINKNQIDVEVYGYCEVGQGTNTSPSASDQSKADNRAKSKFLNKLDDALSSVELGQDLGEWRETVHGVTSPLSSLRKKVLGYLDSVKKLKKGFPKSGTPNLVKAVADTYLEWTFGWHPLALDIADAVVGLRERANRYRVIPIHAGSKNVYGGGYTPPAVLHQDPSNFLNVVRSITSQLSYSVRYKGEVVRKLVDGAIPVNEVLQLDLPHFIPTAWDLLPYSFIVDYFTNVGDIIRYYSARTSQVAWCCKTTRTVYRHDNSVRIVNSNAQTGSAWQVQSIREDGCNSYVEITSFTRSSVNPNTDLRPSIQIHMPVSEKPWENIAAILAARISPLVPLIRSF